MAAAGVHSDFEPLTSPRDAVDQGDLIVEGTVVEVTDGIELRYANPAYTQRQANSYMTLVVKVTEVIDGDAGQLANGLAYVSVFKNAAASTRDLAAANP